MKKLAALTTCLLIAMPLAAQTSAELQTRIKAEVDARSYAAAITDLRDLRAKDESLFKINNYDYLLGWLAERTGDIALAMAAYQSAAKEERDLSPYAKWHLS